MECDDQVETAMGIMTQVLSGKMRWPLWIAKVWYDMGIFHTLILQAQEP